jgi:hypothetical protein
MGATITAPPPQVAHFIGWTDCLDVYAEALAAESR